MYADDLAIISSEKEIGTAKARLQTCLERLEKWMEDWAMNINASKTTYTIFTLSPKLLRLKLKIRDKWLEREDNPRYLGITFDPRLTWKKHLEETQTKGVRRTALLKKLAGTTWGANQAVLKGTYVGYTRPAIEYGIAVWGTTAKSNLKKMARIIIIIRCQIWNRHWRPCLSKHLCHQTTSKNLNPYFVHLLPSYTG